MNYIEYKGKVEENGFTMKHTHEGSANMFYKIQTAEGDLVGRALFNKDSRELYAHNYRMEDLTYPQIVIVDLLRSIPIEAKKGETLQEQLDAANAQVTMLKQAIEAQNEWELKEVLVPVSFSSNTDFAAAMVAGRMFAPHDYEESRYWFDEKMYAETPFRYTTTKGDVISMCDLSYARNLLEVTHPNKPTPITYG